MYKRQILYDGHNVYINGMAMAWPAGAQVAISRLANARRLRGADVSGIVLIGLLHGWYCDGYLDLD